jgi:transcriptional regulator with XRE-family HTH domain
MSIASLGDAGATPAPGERIRLLRKRLGLTLSQVGERTGLAVSTLSKLEKGHASLSFDKLMALSKAFGVEMSELLDATAHAPDPGEATGFGRRVIQHVGDGQLVETDSYRQLFLAGELLRKKCTPILVELRARTLEAFHAEFGGLIRHPGEEFAYVLEGTVEFHSELYAPVRLAAGDSLYFDSEMAHAYLRAGDETTRILSVCMPRGTAEPALIEQMVHASGRLQAEGGEPATPRGRRTVHRAR